MRVETDTDLDMTESNLTPLVDRLRNESFSDFCSILILSSGKGAMVQLKCKDSFGEGISMGIPIDVAEINKAIAMLRQSVERKTDQKSRHSSN